MNGIIILYPILVHVFLVISLYVILGVRKSEAVKNNSVDLKEAALNNQAWPPNVILVSNNIANQFESPILFYILCIVTYLTNSTGIVAVSLACFYVVLRYIHSYIHIGSNYVPYRLRVFVLSVLTILALLIQTSVQVVGNA